MLDRFQTLIDGEDKYKYGFYGTTAAVVLYTAMKWKTMSQNKKYMHVAGIGAAAVAVYIAEYNCPDPDTPVADRLECAANRLKLIGAVSVANGLLVAYCAAEDNGMMGGASGMSSQQPVDSFF